MNVIQRNFFTLLRSGAFGSRGTIEPMSAWKWNRLYRLSLMHGVAALVYDGIRRHSADFFIMQMPAELTDLWRRTTEDTKRANERANAATAQLTSRLSHEQLRPILLKGQAAATLYDNPLHRTPGDVDIYLPYAPQAAKADSWARSNGDDVSATSRHTLQYTWNGTKVEHHRNMLRMTNRRLNRRLQTMAEQEIRECDSEYAVVGGCRTEVLPPTLSLLHALARITRYILNEGIGMKQLTDLGMFLRKAGHRVDYVKLQSWLAQLGMQDMARLIAGLMMRLLDFTEDELPFISGAPYHETDGIVDDMFRLTDRHADNWYFTQGKNIFVSASNSNAMIWQMKHSAKYFRYYPGETVTNFLSSFAHSISHIEE